MAPLTPSVTKAFWIAVIALIIGLYGFWKRYQFNDWYLKVARYDQHIYQCHLEPTTTHATAADIAACAGTTHVPPPPPPPPWY